MADKREYGDDVRGRVCGMGSSSGSGSMSGASWPYDRLLASEDRIV